MLDNIVQSCRYLLNNYPEAQSIKEYLDNRLSSQSQELFQFGYFPSTNNIQVLSDLVGKDILLQRGLLYFRSVEDSLFPRDLQFCYFENHPLTMPFRDPYGNIVGLVCRTLLSDQDRKAKNIPKYKNTKNFKKGNCLFGLFENKKYIVQQNSAYIVEGRFDAIKAMEIGLRNIVAIGNNMMTSYQLSAITRYTNNIFLLLDNDDAGEMGRKRTLSKFGHLAHIRNFYLPELYKDIDEYITNDQIGDSAELSFIVKD